MKLPIVAYGDPVLRKVADEIDEDYPNLKQLIADMFETMYAASGVGLAAPQVGLPIRLFVIDATPFAEDNKKEKEDEPHHYRGRRKRPAHGRRHTEAVYPRQRHARAHAHHTPLSRV